MTLLYSSSNAYAQLSPSKLKSTGIQLFENGKYTEALPYFLKYQESKKGDADLFLKTGICQYYANNLYEAKKYLNFVTENDKAPEPLTYLFLARTYQSEFKFKEAAKLYKKYLSLTKSSAPDRKTVRDEIRRCATGVKVKALSGVGLVENLGDKVNTPFDEWAPLLSPNYDNKMYFSTRRKGNLGTKRNVKGMEDESYGEYCSDMYATRIINGEWSGVSPMSSLLNTPYHDVILDFSNDGSVMFFYKGFNLYSGEIYVDTFKSAEERTMFPPKFESPMMASEGDGTPHIVNDSTFIFSSRRTGGYGGRDLYFVVKSYNGWTKPQNLGPNINTAYDESAPFLAKNGLTLYFSSNNSRTSIGGMDVFKSIYNTNEKEWSLPSNMGIPINSVRDDKHFILSQDGMKGYLSSDRKESKGMRDIFVVYFKSAREEQKAAYASTVFSELERQRLMASTEDNLSKDPTASLSEENIPVYDIAPLYYEGEDDILTPNNIKNLNTIVNLMAEYPSLRVMMTCHSDDDGPLPFNLYFTIKRAEQAAAYLTNNGVNGRNIHLRGVGTNYPIAESMTSSGVNRMGKKLNQRIDIDIIKDNNERLKLTYQKPEVSKFIANTKGSFFDQMEKGLYYKIQIASLKQMYNGELIEQYPDAMVEKESSSQLYRYTIGMYRTYNSAIQLRKELIQKGYTDNYIIPYVKGNRITSIYTAKNYTKEYPDLLNYINGN